MFRLQAQLQGCIAVGRRQAGSGELAGGSAADRISSACAKYYSDIAFLTDTNCSSNKHRWANPRTFIRAEKDERKGQWQKAFESWPGVAGLRESGETSVHSWDFLLRGPETQHQAFGICFHRDTQSLCWYIHFLS